MSIEQRADRIPTVSHPRRWLILAVVLCAECMDLLDSTVVNLATPTIKRDLHTGTTAIQWIAGGYALMLAIGLVTGGRLGDRYGRSRIFLIGAAGFTTASVVCGLAPNSGTLIVFRLVQGAFAALMMPQGFGILRSVFAPEDIGGAFALFGPVIGLSAVLGPILGGALVEAGTWRWVFLINLPLGAAAIAGAALLVPESKAQRPPRLDPVGVGLLSAALGLLVYPLIEGRELGWPTWTYLSMGASAVLLIAFALWVRRVAATGGDPLVPPRLFAKRGYTAGLLVVFVLFAGMIGIMLTVGLYLQLGLGFSAIHAGLTFVPWALGMTVGATVSGGFLGPKYGRSVLQGGGIVMLAGLGWLLYTVHDLGLKLTSWHLTAPYALWGMGLGLLVAPLFDIVVAAVDEDDTGSGSGVLNAAQQLAGAVGVAALGTIFFAAVPSPGFVEATERTLLVAAGLGVLMLALTPLMPRRARPEAPVPLPSEAAVPQPA